MELTLINTLDVANSSYMAAVTCGGYLVTVQKYKIVVFGWKDLTQPAFTILSPDTVAFTSVAISILDRYVAVATDNEEVRFYNVLEEMKPLNVFRLHNKFFISRKNNVSSLSYCKKSDTLAVFYDDKVWIGKFADFSKRELHQMQECVTYSMFLDDGTLATSNGGSFLHIREVRKDYSYPPIAHGFHNHGGSHTCFVQIDGYKIASGALDGKITLHDTLTRSEKKKVLFDQYDEVVCLAKVSDTILASATGSGRVIVWDVVEPKKLYEGRHMSRITSLHVTGGKLVSSARDGSIKIWDVSEFVSDESGIDKQEENNECKRLRQENIELAKKYQDLLAKLAKKTTKATKRRNYNLRSKKLIKQINK